MDRTERFYKIEHLLTERGVVPVRVFLDALEVSLATFKRDIEYLRRRLRVTYRARSKDETTERELSPQRLVFYRGNWYLDAWCHLRNGLRSFSIDSLRQAELLDARAKNLPEAELEAFLASGYGIYSGKRTEWARLKFSPAAALKHYR